MKKKVLFAVLIALVLSLVFASTALAVSQSTINAIIKDAQDGHLDGNWTAAEVRAALAYLENSPISAQYSNLEAVLASYTGGSSQPGVAQSGGSLAFTGINVLVALGAGAGLVGGGLMLRRRG